MTKLTRKTFLMAAVALACGSAMAQAPWQPTKTITIVVPFTAAGSNDIIARGIANEMSQSLKVSVVVDNKPGAGGMLGAGLVAKAPPDGYTIMLGSSSLTIGMALKTTNSFDYRKDLTPIALAASGPMMLVTSNKSPANSPKEFIALAKASPGKLTYGSSGIGSLPHLGTELMSIAGGFQLLHVPYKGGAPILNDLMGGQIELYLGSMPQVLPLIRAGKIKPIAVTSAKRFPLVPDIPAMSEALPGFSFDLWWGVYGPGNMPREIVTRLNAEINKALQSDSIRKFAESEGVTPGALTPAQFSDKFLKEVDGWVAVGKKAKISMD